jgi:TonB family protein
MNGPRNRPVFNDSILPDRRARWDLFGASFAAECVILTALIVIPMLMPQQMEAVKNYWVTPFEAPRLAPWKPQPRPKPKLIPVKRVVVKEIPKPEIVLPKPKIYNPVITTPQVRRVAMRKEVPAPEVAKMFHDPTPTISTGSSAIPTLQKPRALVQTGGFGDPYGLKAQDTKITRSPNANAAGSFDLPPGPGYGNGTGGAKGARGIVASAGFGNGVATGGNGGNRGKLQQDTFADDAAAPAQERAKRTAAQSNDKPVEVLFKPRPAYTQEALAKRIEGEVLLQVVFTASGNVEVGRIVKGLGYGLDASAETAAREIRFHPAERDGQPVDSSAIVHIVFELAY